MAKCPACGRDLTVAEQEAGAPPGAAGSRGRWRPFCSERCKLVDLGRWLNEDYTIAGPSTAPAGPWDGLDPSAAAELMADFQPGGRYGPPLDPEDLQ